MDITNKIYWLCNGGEEYSPEQMGVITELYLLSVIGLMGVAQCEGTDEQYEVSYRYVKEQLSKIGIKMLEEKLH